MSNIVLRLIKLQNIHGHEFQVPELEIRCQFNLTDIC